MVALADTLTITAGDPSGQRKVTATTPRDASIGELVDQLSTALNINRLDRSGKPLAIQALLERESRHLARSERVADVLQQGDSLIMHPRVMAGGKPA